MLGDRHLRNVQSLLGTGWDENRRFEGSKSAWKMQNWVSANCRSRIWTAGSHLVALAHFTVVLVLSFPETKETRLSEPIAI